jgi:UDP-4-amino-4,6-dideoxy-N-acetyl-beta-L-altrosamine N-acetyltransferase
MSVELRDLRREDGPRVLAWRNADHVAAYMYADHAITADEHAAWLDAALSAPDRRYWIIEDDGVPVGLVNLTRINRAWRRCDWAYYLGDPNTRGKGIGACVELMVLDYVFGTLGMNKLCCEVFADNEAVWKLHESFGFTREACYRDHVFKAGRFRDVIALAILASDWAAARPACAARLRDKGRDPDALRIRDS